MPVEMPRRAEPVPHGLGTGLIPAANFRQHPLPPRDLTCPPCVLDGDGFGELLPPTERPKNASPAGGD